MNEEGRAAQAGEAGVSGRGAVIVTVISAVIVVGGFYLMLTNGFFMHGDP